jgi:type IV pilus assembly protein PilY1
MTTVFKLLFNNKIAQQILLLTTLAFGGNALAETALSIATSPLVNSTASQVSPNLMYILDNSGSMDWQDMPDYVGHTNNTGKCKRINNGVISYTAECTNNDPPYNSPDFNGIAYNPEITYLPTVDAAGNQWKDMNGDVGPVNGSLGVAGFATTASGTATNGWTQVPEDAYGAQDNTRTSLVPTANGGGYADTIFCTLANPSAAQIASPATCRRNSQYMYPDTTFTNRVVVRGYPYYYKINAGEYCTTKNLTTCVTATAPITVGTTNYDFPAKYRWCKVANGNINLNDCQGKYNETTFYTAIKYSGISNGSSAVGTIKIDLDTGCGGNGLPSCTSAVPLNVTSVMVNGINIVALPTSGLTINDTTSATKRNTLAANIAAAINSFVPTNGDPDFTATSTADIVTITPVATGVFTGTITMATTTNVLPTIAGAAATGSITILRAGKLVNPTGTATISTIKVGNSSVAILNGGVTSLNALDSVANRLDFAKKIKDSINTKINTPIDYLATCGAASTSTIGNACTSATIIITAVIPNTTNPFVGTAGNQGSGNISINPGANTGASSTLNYSSTAVAGGVDAILGKTYSIPATYTAFSGGSAVVNSFTRVDIVPSAIFPKGVGRTDCAGADCTYAEEMTNFANWFAYYKTRMQMMKTSSALAFRFIGVNYRIGFMTINTNNGDTASNYLPINTFNLAQKTSWYNALFRINPNNGTPLRAALSTAGKIYAGKNPIAGVTADPVQYSCQQNFTLLTTDGYWNGAAGSKLDNSGVGNQDGFGTARPKYEGVSATAATTANPNPAKIADTLSDVSKYYYDTDLRTPALGNCNGSAGFNVCENNVFTSATDNNVSQHMGTFTLGLGVDGQLDYEPEYAAATSGDYFDITQGTIDWPSPGAGGTQTAVDDLWHAAVNGQGTYFSAKDPSQLSKSLNDALQSIDNKVGAGAAAATSTLNPVSGNNFAFVASYTTGLWAGNLEKRTINLTSGAVEADAVWCVENVLPNNCSLPGTIVPEDDPITGETRNYCVTTNTTVNFCNNGVFSGNTCKKLIASSCTGAMVNNVGKTLSNRNILMRDLKGGTTSLVPFRFDNLSAAQQGYFGTSYVSNRLSQWASLSSVQKAKATDANLVNFLRGETGFEDRLSNIIGSGSAAINNRLFRFRSGTIGDALESTPVFVGPPSFSYTDLNYGPETVSTSFKGAKATRGGTIYMGTNDGMLHAFNGADGEERWAYIPSMVMPNLVNLADKSYAGQHTNYVNGDAITADVCFSNCNTVNADWGTILVGGLNGGGEGYYALNITDPDSPSLIWEFRNQDDIDLGASFGSPVITKKADGTWVVLVTSGYNNTKGTVNSGKGILYILSVSGNTLGKPTTVDKLITTAGSASSPSGLAKISSFAQDPSRNNTSVYVYGGDLDGNLWRFDINAPQATDVNPFKMAVLKDNGNPKKSQPITVVPELATVAGKRTVFVGTGKYLQTTDLTDTQQQTLYAITDDDSGVTFDDPRGSGLLVEQTLFTDGAGRKISSEKTVNYSNKRGWFIDLPDTGERQNVASKLVFGTLLVPTIVPSNTVCSPGGYGYLNFLDYRTGGTAVGGDFVSSKTNAPIVGINVVFINGQPKTSIVVSNNPTPIFPTIEPTFANNLSSFSNSRAIWRELINE